MTTPLSLSNCICSCGEIFAPRIHEYDLREREAILRLYQDARPHIVIH